MTKTVVDNKNKLAYEKSPYLLQHAENPVNWYPWSEEAFAVAKEQNKPIFLSIGYSTCHWCHVMAHESFEDKAVAELINDIFVPIKVDREERPDIDNAYMTVCQMMTGSGGWPLTIFMTSEKKPFFAATYIPKKNRFGRKGLLNLLAEVKEKWNDSRENLLNTANRITEILKENETTNREKVNNSINQNIFNEAYTELKHSFDEHYGGFGRSPKFPMPHQSQFLFNYYRIKHNNTALAMAEKNLQHMRAGGIYDHIGYGFHRYSTDEKWILPHFEKMLYDQALLMNLYTTAYQITEKDIYKNTVEEIFLYIQNKMTDKGGGFFSAEDADSEGEEGKFYLWEDDEIRSNLKNKSEELIELYNITKEGNFRDESTGENTGKNILYLNQKYDNMSELLKEEQKYYSERKILYEKREKRIHPHKDDKILTDWNGIMIAVLARASFVFDNNSYLRSAEKAALFIQENMIEDSSLLHRYREGESAIRGTINDYAFFIWGLIELYQTTFHLNYLSLAIKLKEYMIDKFWDKENGGFFMISSEEDDILFRNKEVYDGAIPSGNSIALGNLLRLSHLTGNYQYEDKADQMTRFFSEKIRVTPSAYCQFLNELQSIMLPYYDIIIVSDREDNLTKEILDFLRKNYHPNVSLILIPPDKSTEEYKKLEKEIGFIKNYKQIQNKPTIYLCENYNCNQPITNPEELYETLNSVMP